MVRRTMQVIFDISVLGVGHYHPRSRTGIFRVVENLAQELVKTGAVSSFSSLLGISSYFDCVDYLQSKPTLGGVTLSKPSVNEVVLRIFQYLNTRTHKNNSAPWHIQGMNKLANGVANITLGHKTINSADLVAADIYHSPFYPIPEYIKRNVKLKKIITIYDLIAVLHPQYFQFQEDNLIHNILKSIDNETWVTCISHATKSDLCNYLPWLDPSKVIVTHLAASSLFYRCHDQTIMEKVRTKFSIPDGPYILSLSTLEPRKNITQTIRCFVRLVEQEKINDLALVLVGSKGWDFDSIFEEIAANPKIRDRIIVTGYVADEDLAPLYSAAMMFVYPSFYEGFGLPPLEAMQCGIPIITSNTSSLPEVVGKAGVMIDPNDDDELCGAMLKIYNSADVRKKMSVDSLAQAHKFSWKQCAEQTIDTYTAAIAR
jgi:glycosyltransferase involved in cell wall biosynthesis